MNKKTNLDIILNLEPGEEYVVYFPNDFVLEYKKQINGEVESFTPKYLEVYFWDEEDHWGKDYYFYDGNSSNWVCKLYYLTPESRLKFYNYITEPHQIKK